MWLGEPHPSPGKRFSYQTVRRDNKVTKGDRVVGTDFREKRSACIFKVTPDERNTLLRKVCNSLPVHTDKRPEELADKLRFCNCHFIFF